MSAIEIVGISVFALGIVLRLLSARWVKGGGPKYERTPHSAPSIESQWVELAAVQVQVVVCVSVATTLFGAAPLAYLFFGSDLANR